MAAVEIEQVAVVEGPDPVGVLGMVEEDVRPHALHRIRHRPGEAVEQDVEGAAIEDLVPEVEQQRGPRVLPPPEPGPAGADRRQGAGALAPAAETAAVQPLLLRPPPAATARVPPRTRWPPSPSGVASVSISPWSSRKSASSK